MDPKSMNNELLRQVRTAVETVDSLNATMPYEHFARCVPKEDILKTRKVILTGCGDSYCAGIAARPVYENPGINNVGAVKAEAWRNIEFTRYYDTYRRWWTGEGNDIPLVLGVSISGKVRRVIEAMARTNHYGGVSVAFTDNPESDFAKEAQHVVSLGVPENHPAPCVTSYFGSTFGLMAFGLYHGVARGKMTEEQEREARQALVDYAHAYTPAVMEDLENKMLAITQKWIDAGVDNMDFIGDGADYATAFYGSAKMVESFGGLTTNDDSEDWNHINYFMKNPEKVGTFVVANTTCPSFDRLLETINTCTVIGRPTVVITDGDASLFPDGVDVITLPKPKYPWANPLMQHIPMDYVAAFWGLIKGIPDFRPDSPVHQLDEGAKRFRESAVVII